jgi:subtilisin family serine protease
MGEVFDSQFQAMSEAFAREGIIIAVAYAPNGRPDYMYEAGRLLVSRKELDSVLAALPPGVQHARKGGQPDDQRLVVLSIENLEGGVHLTVPQALDLIDASFGDKHPALNGGFPPATPVHILHVSNGHGGAQPDTVRACAATEPEVPYCCPADEPCGPCPPPAPDGGAGVVIGVCDTGLLADIAADPWLGGIAAAPGDIDQLGPLLASGLHAIPPYCGHGTFIAGVARCEAPEAAVYVANDFIEGGQREWVIMQQLQALAGRSPAPQVVNLSAGSYSRNDWPLLSFSAFESGGITLTCAAGNDGTYRQFWPAAFDWAVAVGALGADQRNRAWFTNYGDWVNVYTLGEGLVNAFATGEYTYHEPPKRPATQVFDGRARWSGTSFAAPLVAGLIAAEMSQAGLTAADATQAVLARAQSQAIPGIGPVLYPR